MEEQSITLFTDKLLVSHVNSYRRCDNTRRDKSNKIFIHRWRSQHQTRSSASLSWRSQRACPFCRSDRPPFRPSYAPLPVNNQGTAYNAARFSLVGSIGTMIEGWDAHRLLERFDISQRVYSSGPLKSMLSPFLPMSEEADKKARDLVQQAGKLFVDDLKQARGTRLRADIDYGTGEVWSGEQARAIGLVDEIGTLDEVVAKNFKVKAYDFSPSRHGFGALMSMFQGFSQVLNQNITTTLAPQIR